MTTLARWQAAQEYERAYWQSRAEQIVAGVESQLDWYQWRAGQLSARLARLGMADLAGGSARVLEVGSGPVGVAAYFPAAERVAVDPLAAFYAGVPTLTALRTRGVEYREGIGERLPCSTGDFDLAIIENCIDHVQDMLGVMRELRRALRPEGILYLTVNCRMSAGYYVHRALSRLRIDAGHPHTFTPPRVIELLRRTGFDPVDVQLGSYWKAFRQDLRSSHPRDRAKALIGVSEFEASLVARRA